MSTEEKIFKIPAVLYIDDFEKPFKMKLIGDYTEDEKAIVRTVFKRENILFDEVFKMPENIMGSLISRYREVCYQAMTTKGVVGTYLSISEKGILKHASVET